MCTRLPWWELKKLLIGGKIAIDPGGSMLKVGICTYDAASQFAEDIRLELAIGRKVIFFMALRLV